MIGVIFKKGTEEVAKILATQEAVSSQIPSVGDYVSLNETDLQKKLVVERTFIYGEKRKEIRDIIIQIS